MVNSLVWTAEEAKYLKAIFHWQDTATASDEEKRRQEDARKQQQQQQNAPQDSADEIRILVLGGRGTGKTAILTRFAQDSFPPAQSYAQGCRRTITLTASPTSTRPAAQSNTNNLQPPTRIAPSPPTQRVHPTQPQQRPQPQSHSPHQPRPPQQQQPLPPPRNVTLALNITEFPWQHLPSNPRLGRALHATDAAVLVYSVRDPSSLKLAAGLAEFVGEYFAGRTETEAELLGNGNGVSLQLPSPSRPDSGWGSTPSSVTGLGIESGLRSRWGRGSTAGSALASASAPASSRSGSGSGSGSGAAKPSESAAAAVATGPLVSASVSASVPPSQIHGVRRVGLGSRDGIDHRDGDRRGDAGSSDRGRMYPVILVGNKCDSDDDAGDDTLAALLGGSGRVVSWEEGAAAARVMIIPGPASEVPFLEVSAKTGEGVEEVFRVIGEEVLKVRRLAQMRDQAGLGRMESNGAGLAKPVAGEESRKKAGFWRTLSAVFGRRRTAEGR